MDANTGMHQFTLTDARGVAHQYVVAEHPGGEGMELMFALMSLGAPSVVGLATAAMKSGDLLGAVLRAVSGGESGVGTTAELGQLFADLDLASVGGDLGRAFATGRCPDLTRKVLSRTHRDGKPLATSFANGQPLPGQFDIAYQANYAELLQAVWKVCTINRFFPVPSMSGSSSDEATKKSQSALPVA